MKLICERAEKCNYITCFHRTEHDQEFICRSVGSDDCTCVPVKEESKPYFANARIGDRVVDKVRKEGTIREVTSIDIKVDFGVDGKRGIVFDLEGKYYTYDNQTLYYAGTTFTVNDAGEPKRMKKAIAYINLYIVGSSQLVSNVYLQKDKAQRMAELIATQIVKAADPIEIEIPEDMEI